MVDRCLLTTVLAATLLGCGAPPAAPAPAIAEPVCPPNSVWNGKNCMATQVVVQVECPAGATFRDGRCVPAEPSGQGACAAGAAAASGAAIPITDPSAKFRAEQALYALLEPQFRACMK